MMHWRSIMSVQPCSERLALNRTSAGPPQCQHGPYFISRSLT